jgi:SpoVK/Ycf46/Vps4 family AAA+-type ATPase
MGKTSAAAGIAHELGVPAYGVSIPELVSKYMGGTGENLAKLFGQLRDGAVVVFDEIDAIGGSRTAVDQTSAAERNQIVNTLLTLLDRRGGGVLVATTNRADVLDPALRRRFDETLVFPSATPEQQATLARRLEAKFGLTQWVDLCGCENFDAVTKRVTREARRIVMAEILAAKAAGAEDIDEEAADAAE